MSMESSPSEEREKAPISNDSQESFLFDLPHDPQELTDAHYEALDKRYGVMIDAYIQEGRIRDGVFQGALWLEIHERTKHEIPQSILLAYIHNKRNLKLSSSSQTVPWSTSKVIRSGEATKSPSKKSSTLRTPSKPPFLSQKAKGANDDSFDEERPMAW